MDYDLKFKVTAPFYSVLGDEIVADVGDIVEGYIGDDGRPTIVTACGHHMYTDVQDDDLPCGRAVVVS